MNTRDALEAALAADPDDVAAHSAYADLLIDAGDPRGEYIRLQLALEDRNQPADRLRAMEQEAFALRREHEADWLGPLAEFVLPQRGPSVGAMVADNVEVTWRRGWVHRLTIPRLTADIAGGVWGSFRIAWMLHELVVRSVADGDLDPLIRWHDTTLRKVEFGVPSTFGEFPYVNFRGLSRLERLRLHGVRSDWLAIESSIPIHQLCELEITTDNGHVPLVRLADIATLSRLQRLHLDVVDRDEPTAANHDVLRTFFRSAHFPIIQYLTLRLPGFGDAGVDELIASGMLARLKGLDLCRCEITDDGARALAGCSAVSALEYLHLDNNLLSPIGIEALAAVGVTVSDRQMYGDGGDIDG